MTSACPFTVEDSRFLKLNEALLRDPYPENELVREQGPAVREPEYGVFLVGRHEDVQHVLLHPQLFSSIQNADAPYAALRCPLDDIVEWRASQPFGDKLLTNDPPDHGRWRSLVNRFFTPRRVNALEPTIRAHVVELIDGFVGDGEVELVGRLADVLPPRSSASSWACRASRSTGSASCSTHASRRWWRPLRIPSRCGRPSWPPRRRPGWPTSSPSSTSPRCS